MGLLGQVQGDLVDILSNIDITFKRNVVNVMSEQLDNAIKASTVISKRSVLSMLDGIIDNVDEELDRLAQEKEESIEFMQDNFNGMHSDKEQPQEVEEESVDDTDDEE